MDKVIINGLTLYGHHGVDKIEQELGQKLYIDIELRGDLSKACLSDNIKDTINYKEVYKVVARIADKKRYNLLEALAEDVARAIIERFRPDEVMVRIRKPHAPIEGVVDHVGCEIIRRGGG